MPKIDQEIYRSSTLGDIPLSFTGRHLLQNLREAVIEALAQGSYTANEQQLSQVRGKIAQYISGLERRSLLGEASNSALLLELNRRLRGSDGEPDGKKYSSG